MGRKSTGLILVSFFLIVFQLLLPFKVNAQGATSSAQVSQISALNLPGGVSPPEMCKSAKGDARSHCPKVEGANYSCAPDYDSWLKDKTQNFWVNDPEVTALGKGGERSRQFLLWTLTHPSDDDSPNIMSIWMLSRNIAYFMLLIIAIFMGLGIMIGQRGYFNLKVDVSPLFIKLVSLLLYVTFSAAIVLMIIQVSDILIEFFIRTLGVRELFNIYFLPENQIVKNPGNVQNVSETAYQTFQGCSNIKIDALESVRTSKFLVRFTNMTYYFIGIMFLLRKVVLWFLLIVSPFLAVLAPFIFIRNIGWIWIGVFFQWVFYGPLAALFLGGMSRIWNSPRHIPFIFDFSRVQQMQSDASKIIYPTTTNILYGGPAQKLQLYNTSSYVDTFAEYIISLIMLWTVIILPWWLLRIFRDYCCEGILAMKNILMAMYDSFKAGGLGPPPGPSPVSPVPTGRTSTAMKLPKDREIQTTVKLATVQEIKKAQTVDITKSIEIHASKLTDIAHIETNKQTRENVVKNINFLQNPMKAETTTDRQRFMTMRTELYDRAVKGDQMAKQAVMAFSSQTQSLITEKQRLVKSMPQMAPVIRTTSIKVGLPQEKTTKVVSSLLNSIASSDKTVSAITERSAMPATQVKTVLTSLSKSENMTQSASSLISKISAETRIEKVKVEHILQSTEKFFAQDDLRGTIVTNISKTFNIPADKINVIIVSMGPQVDLSQPSPDLLDRFKEQANIEPVKLQQVILKSVSDFAEKKNMIHAIAQAEGVPDDTVQKVIATHLPAIAQPEKHIEDQITIPPTVSIEDYEEVKSMWSDQYQKGEVPLSNTINSRVDWLNTDIIALTNILNKITSADPQLKAQGLDDIGYILPIFMVNNMKGEELAVYLKAKLEAAKQVKHDIEKEEEIRGKLDSQKEEEFVEVERPKAQEAAKTMEMKAELPEKEPSRGEQAAQSRVKESVVDERMTKSQAAEINQQQNVQVPQAKSEDDRLNALKDKIEEKTKEVA